MIDERELLVEIRYVRFISKLNFRKLYRGWMKYCDTIFEVKRIGCMCVRERIRRLILIYKEFHDTLNIS